MYRKENTLKIYMQLKCGVKNFLLTLRESKIHLQDVTKFFCCCHECPISSTWDAFELIWLFLCKAVEINECDINKTLVSYW